MKRPLLALLAAVLGACERTPPPPRPDPTPSATAAAQARSRAVAFHDAPASGSVDELVRAEQERARQEGQRLLVYVGATWCEPCQRFHRAVEAGNLEGQLPPLRMLEFDLDRDGDRLKAAGYRSRMIPLFALPGPDGRGSGQQIEGSIKGEGAVAEITPRLRKLIGEAP